MSLPPLKRGLKYAIFIKIFVFVQSIHLHSDNTSLHATECRQNVYSRFCMILVRRCETHRMRFKAFLPVVE